QKGVRGLDAGETGSQRVQAIGVGRRGGLARGELSALGREREVLEVLVEVVREAGDDVEELVGQTQDIERRLLAVGPAALDDPYRDQAVQDRLDLDGRYPQVL